MPHEVQEMQVKVEEMQVKMGSETPALTGVAFLAMGSAHQNFFDLPQKTDFRIDQKLDLSIDQNLEE